MWQVVDFVDGEGPLPAILEKALQAQRWGALPEPGGLLDQGAGLVQKMTYALNVYENWSAYLRAERSGDAARMKASDPQFERFVNHVLRSKWERDSG